MISSEDKARESIIAFLLIVFCLTAVVLGLFVIKKESDDMKKGNKNKIMGTLLGDRVAVIPLEGMIYDSIQSHGTFRPLFNVGYLKKQLNKAKKDSHVKAVLLRLNSPGGTIAASQEVYGLIKEIRAAGKPVVASMTDLCASGCYYIASATDAIVANRGTLTGSIGVISQGMNFKGLLDKIGVVDQTFKAGKYKDIGSGSRILSVEEKEILQSLLNDSYKQFLDDIEQARNIDRAALEKSAQGLIYTGQQALEVNLVDYLGDYSKAREVTKEILKNKYKYEHPEKIKFTEVWTSKNLSSFEEIFDLGIGGFFKTPITEIFNRLNLISENQLMWLAN